MTIALYYLILSLLLAGFCFFTSQLWLQIIVGWTALSLFVVSSAYWFNSASIFRKRTDGSLPWYSRWLFIPFFLGVRSYNALARHYDKVPAVQRISGDLYLGARLTERDIPQLTNDGVAAILDVTAEFAALDWATRDEDIQYLNIPVLDHAVPSEAQLKQAVRWMHAQQAQQRKILVHCALGRGRSVLVMAAFLLSRHTDRSAERAVSLIKRVRQTARLNKTQLKALRTFARQYDDTLQTKAWLIANPVSGGGKWRAAQADIIELLSPFMQLTVKTTSQTLTATKLAAAARADGANLVIACGGDGTVGAVAAELVGTSVRLGIIPLGTTNALSHALWGISAKLLPVRSACINIIEGHSQPIDTARCNGQSMLLLAGVGFEQQMIAAADRQRKNELGQLAYLDGLWRALQSNKLQQLWVKFDDGAEQLISTSSLVVANAAPLTTLLAQGMGAPDAADGQLDVTWLASDDTEGPAISSMLELMYAGITQMPLHANIQHRWARRVRIRANEALHYVIDGELASSTSLDIEILPASLFVMLPHLVTEE